MKTNSWSEEEIAQLGRRIGAAVSGGEILELIGDVGAGKTTLTRAIARGMGIEGPIQSPTFTISNRYETTDGLVLAHYDFYRLSEAGIMAEELDEVLDDVKTVTVIEWADVVQNVLPSDRLSLFFETDSETSRKLVFKAGGVTSSRLLENIS